MLGRGIGQLEDRLEVSREALAMVEVSSCHHPLGVLERELVHGSESCTRLPATW